MYKPLLLFLLSLIALKCGGEKDLKAKLKVKASTEKPTNKDQLSFELKVSKGILLDSVHFKSKGVRVESPLALESYSLGSHELIATAFYKGKSSDFKATFWIYSKEKPSLMSYRVLNSYPHDSTAYTQGLEFDGDDLYESTGLNGKSTVRKVNFKTGEILGQQKLDAVYFGEGLTLVDDRIIQLTWKANMGFVYQKETLQMIDSFLYDRSKQGWGLCYDENELSPRTRAYIKNFLEADNFEE